MALPTLLMLLAAASPNPRAEARQLFDQASAQFASGDFDSALSGFTQAYQLDPEPGFLFNIGQCHRSLRHWELASTFFHRYLDADPAAPNAAHVQELIAEVDAQKAVSPAPPPLAAPPLVIREDSATANPAITQAPPPPQTSSSGRLGPWILGGAGVAGGIAGGILGGVALSIAGSNTRTSDGSSEANSITLSQANQANTMATVSLVLVVAGATAIAGAIAWGLTTSPSTPAGAASR